MASFPFRVQRLAIRVRSSRHYISRYVSDAAYPRQNQPKPLVADHHEHEEHLLKRIKVGGRDESGFRNIMSDQLSAAMLCCAD